MSVKFVSIFSLVHYVWCQSCVYTPLLLECEYFTLTNNAINTNITSICNRMQGMTGCSLDNLCNKISSSSWCSPFQILKTLCLDKPSIPECSSYNLMCQNGSVVSQCETPILPLPSSQDVRSLIKSICNSMRMTDECDTCPQGVCTDALSAYSNLCISIPDMTECGDWRSYCSYGISEWPLCIAESGYSFPMMELYFHASLQDYVLFMGWIPQTPVEYFFTILFIIFLGVIHEGAKTVHTVIEQLTILRQKENPIVTKFNKAMPQMKIRRFSWKLEILRTVAFTIQTFLHFVLMLITMTFNVGFFIAVIVGLGLGSLFFRKIS